MAALLGIGIPLLMWAQADKTQPPLRIPSYVAWTEETLKFVSNGDAFHGLVIARRCERCHGGEGFSATASIPNLAGMDSFAFWKQMEDFRAGKRNSRMMQMIADPFSSRDFADLAVYYSMLPTSPDPQDNRSFPGDRPSAAHDAIAVRLITFGDGPRGIPPCQACHGPVSYVRGAPSLADQNAAYLVLQLDWFAGSSRANDINIRMRSIASQLTEDERHAIAEYYGAGLGQFRWAPPWAQR